MESNNIVHLHLWLCTLFPAIKLPRPVPRTVNMDLAISTFSMPWSLLTLNEKEHCEVNLKTILFETGRRKKVLTYLDGHPCFCTLSMKNLKLVSALLFPAALRYKT